MPRTGLFEGAKVEMRVVLPDNYPLSAPKCTFTTKIYHPNVSYSGGICFNLLSGEWKKNVGIAGLVNCMLWFLNNPNFSSPLNGSVRRQGYEMSVQRALDGERVGNVSFEWHRAALQDAFTRFLSLVRCELETAGSKPRKLRSPHRTSSGTGAGGSDSGSDAATAGESLSYRTVNIADLVRGKFDKYTTDELPALLRRAMGEATGEDAGEHDSGMALLLATRPSSRNPLNTVGRRGRAFAVERQNVVKEMVFRLKDPSELVLVVTHGTQRVDRLQVAAALGVSADQLYLPGARELGDLLRASATSICDVGILSKRLFRRVVCASTLVERQGALAADRVIAGIGSRHAVIQIRPADLLELLRETFGADNVHVADVVERPKPDHTEEARKLTELQAVLWELAKRGEGVVQRTSNRHPWKQHSNCKNAGYWFNTIVVPSAAVGGHPATDRPANDGARTGSIVTNAVHLYRPLVDAVTRELAAAAAAADEGSNGGNQGPASGDVSALPAANATINTPPASAPPVCGGNGDGSDDADSVVRPCIGWRWPATRLAVRRSSSVEVLSMQLARASNVQATA